MDMIMITMIACISFVLLIIISLCFRINKKSKMKKNSIQNILKERSVLYIPVLESVYINNEQIKKYDGEVRLKEVDYDGTYPYKIVSGLTSIGATPTWGINERITGNSVQHYLSEVVQMDVNFPIGQEYVFVFCNIGNEKPSSQCFYKILYRNGNVIIAMMCVPMQEYIEKYYDMTLM
ncbi:MAG: hypothetical protein ACK5LC_14965 [Coprobacillaceae bacterium]